MIGDEGVDLRYEGLGKIVGRFVMAADKKPWAMAELLGQKVEKLQPTARLIQLKSTPHSWKPGNVQWKVTWEFKKIDFRSQNLMQVAPKQEQATQESK